jgi:hypothetical protein
MKARVTLILLPILMFALCTAAMADVTFNQDIPTPIISIINPCNGETVDLSGSVHVLAATTSDGSGGFHLLMEDNSQNLKGVGETTGAQYQFVTNSKFTVNVQPPFPSEFTLPSTMNAVSQGSVPNFFVEALFKVTVNADGTLTVAIFAFRTSCHG